jgi:hypothetical protein
MIAQGIILVLFGLFTFLQDNKSFFGFSVPPEIYNSSDGRKLRRLFKILLTVIWIVSAGAVFKTGLIQQKTWPILAYLILPIVICFYMYWRFGIIVRRSVKVSQPIVGDSTFQVSFQNRWIEFFTFIFFISALVLFLSSFSTLPAQIPTKWNLAGNIVKAGKVNVLVFIFLFGWSAIFLLLSMLSSTDAARISKHSSEKVWASRLINLQSYTRLIQSAWLFFYVWLRIESAYNPVNSFFLYLFIITFIGVVFIVAILRSLRKCISSVQKEEFESKILNVFNIIRYRNTIILVFQIIMLINFFGVLIKV